jgi:peroxiredoxin
MPEMARVEPRGTVRVGEPAPDFSVPAVDREGFVGLADYRGTSPVLLVLLRGLWCAFCRRHVEQLAITRGKLQAEGVETLAIVATSPERARLYYRYRPTHVPLGADPDLSTHQAYGVLKMPMTPLTLLKMLTTRVNPSGELPRPVPLMRAGGALNRLDNFESTEADRDDQRHQSAQLTGQFLIDRDGVVRWVNIEGALEGPAGIGKFPTDEDLLAVARTLAR